MLHAFKPNWVEFLGCDLMPLPAPLLDESKYMRASMNLNRQFSLVEHQDQGCRSGLQTLQRPFSYSPGVNPQDFQPELLGQD